MNIKLDQKNTIRRQGQEWVGWQTLSLKDSCTQWRFPDEWQRALTRVYRECQQASVPLDRDLCFIEGRTLYLERSAAERVLRWRVAKAKSTALALSEHALSPDEQQEISAALEGLALPQSNWSEAEQS